MHPKWIFRMRESFVVRKGGLLIAQQRDTPSLPCCFVCVTGNKAVCLLPTSLEMARSHDLPGAVPQTCLLVNSWSLVLYSGEM